MKILKKAISIGLCILTFGTANAALIQGDINPNDGVLVVDTVNGLEWTRLDLTNDNPFAITTFLSQGFRIANESEAALLVAALGGFAEGFFTFANGSQPSPLTLFTNLFGTTDFIFDDPTVATGFSNRNMTRGGFLSGQDSSFGILQVEFFYNETANGLVADGAEFTSFFATSGFEDPQLPTRQDTGLFLVRNVEEVPAPAAFCLIVLSLFAMRRFK